MIIDRMKVLSLWQKAEILPDRVDEMKHIASQIISFKSSLYDQVSTATGVPWYVVGAIDCREESFNHGAYLGNGDPLSRPTRDVPRGRGPFKTWCAGAIDAFHYDGMDHLPAGGHWDIVTALIKCEAFNGMGYAAHGLPSPYVWGATNIQQAGKYTSDHGFDPTIWDHQPGVAALFLALKNLYGIGLNEA